MSDYINSLNPAQKAAATSFQGPSLIVAGAGSGKTRVLTSRIAYMLEQGVDAHSILSLTFTNKAAAEMRERIGALVGNQSNQIWMGTFHSIFARILHYEAELLGFPSSFTIYDSADSKNLIKAIIKEKNLDTEAYKEGYVQSRISLAKNNLITSSAYKANTNLIAEDREKRTPELCEIYHEYTLRCKRFGAMDFDDLLLNINILFRDFPEALTKYQDKFKYILVDEYQDTNYAQYIIIRRLAYLHSNVCVVGDDAQSIYSFRGAKIENILRFKNDFKDAQIFKLEQNYRSTQNIVNAANSIIAKNKNQIKKESFSSGAKGELIKIVKAYTDQEEASIVADKIKDRFREGNASWEDIAILYRTNAQSRVLEEALRRRVIPYKIHGGMSFYQRKEIKDLIAYIRLVVNPKDDEAFKRIINTPRRGIGGSTIEKLQAAAISKNISLWEATSTLSGDELELKSGAANKVVQFTHIINSLSQMRPTTNIYELGMEIATRSGMIGTLKMTPTPENESALENLQELINSMEAFREQRVKDIEANPDSSELSIEPTIEEWLQNVALLTDVDNQSEEDKNKVTLMTVHSSKGLEYKFVFIVGLEENLFPSTMGAMAGDDFEEERRLFYVAVTRAKEAVMLSYAESRFKWGNMEFCRPSRFLGEISEKYVDLDFDLGSSESSNLDTKPRTNYYSKDTIRGAAADKYKSPNPHKPIAQKPINVESRFKSVGTREVSSNQSYTESHLKPGVRVEHSRFGVGEVKEIEHTTGDIKLVIDFVGAGRKTLLNKYAKLTIL
ncbi:MAG: 3'-5' exonuclease [Rikenellaceae bacterium]